METVTAAWNALVAQPLALLMAVIALVFAIRLLAIETHGRDPVLFPLAVVLSGMSAWLMASGGFQR